MVHGLSCGCSLWIQFALNLDHANLMSCIKAYIWIRIYWLILDMMRFRWFVILMLWYHLMEYLRIYHLSKWNPQNKLIHRHKFVSKRWPRYYGSLSPYIVQFLMLMDDNVFLGGEFLHFLNLKNMILRHSKELFWKKKWPYLSEFPLPPPSPLKQ
jgi:archaellum biogenesis protein FlaJ (TadC family)